MIAAAAAVDPPTAAAAGKGAATTAPRPPSPLPDTVVADILSRLHIPDLWAATTASAAWRQVAESAGQSVWRRSFFTTYYRGNTFLARLPDNDVWPLDVDELLELHPHGERPWPAASAAIGAGGTESIVPWSCLKYDRLFGRVRVNESEHAVAAATAPKGAQPNEELTPNSRVRTLCEDFANKDIRSFYGAAPTKAECRANRPRDRAFAYLGWLSDAGRVGWKAFALRVFFGCDLAGRRALLERNLRQQYHDRPTDDRDVSARLQALEKLETGGWRPCAGTIPLENESHIGGAPMCWKLVMFPIAVRPDLSSPLIFCSLQSISVLLVFNRDLSPGVAVFTRTEDYEEYDESSSLSCCAYLGPDLGQRLDFSVTGSWTARAWNRFFTLMFLCNSDRSGVALRGLDNTHMWRESFDCASWVASGKG
ncbi:hypothetical protein DFJ73DRAFT_862730, partial [Zopfochytrium polystomum]